MLKLNKLLYIRPENLEKPESPMKLNKLSYFIFFFCALTTSSLWSMAEPALEPMFEFVFSDINQYIARKNQVNSENYFSLKMTVNLRQIIQTQILNPLTICRFIMASPDYESIKEKHDCREYFEKSEYKTPKAG